MTPVEFGSWAMGYYGPYPIGQRADVAEYLSYLSSAELDELKVQMRATCPSHIGQVNGYPPDIQRMEELAPEVRRVVQAKSREAREIEYAAHFLPNPEPKGYGDLMALDWMDIFRGGKELAERERKKNPEQWN